MRAARLRRNSQSLMFACDTWSYVVDEASMLPMSSPARRATVRAMSESVTFRYVCVWRPRCSRCDTSYPRTMACPPYSSYSASRAVTSPVTSGLVAASPSAAPLMTTLLPILAPVAASTLRSRSRKASTNMAGIWRWSSTSTDSSTASTSADRGVPSMDTEAWMEWSPVAIVRPAAWLRRAWAPGRPYRAGCASGHRCR